jgi:hypothetical protein
MYLICNFHYYKHVLMFKIFNTEDEASNYALNVMKLPSYSFIIKEISNINE